MYSCNTLTEKGIFGAARVFWAADLVGSIMKDNKTTITTTTNSSYKGPMMEENMEIKNKTKPKKHRNKQKWLEVKVWRGL